MEHVIKRLQDLLLSDFDCTIVTELEPVTDEEWDGKDAIAFCDLDYYPEDDYYSFKIWHKESISDESLRRVLCHEFVHAMQLLRGDEFDYTLGYQDREHEIEAYDIEQWLIFKLNMEKGC